MPGGVCAVLDYDVETMAEYVAEQATRLALGTMNVSSAFRKFVSQILTSTRLPRTTILLGMNYLAKRINMMNMQRQQTVKFNEGQVWRMLTTAFLLGSKFLDDNTFQNRSWSEVSGIPVAELNTMERDWLLNMDWLLYVNLDRSSDYNAWLQNWQGWLENKKAQAHRERLLSTVPQIDTDVRRSRPSYATWHQQQVAEYERLQSLNLKRTEMSPQSSIAGQDWYPGRLGLGPMAGSSHPTPITLPMTPPDSGYGTPEYLNSATLNSATTHSTQYNEWFSRGLTAAPFARSGMYQQPQHLKHQHEAAAHRPAYHPGRHQAPAHTGYYGYGHSIWESNAPDCRCGCAGSVHSKPGPYGLGMTHGYGQTVMG